MFKPPTELYFRAEALTRNTSNHLVGIWNLRVCVQFGMGEWDTVRGSFYKQGKRGNTGLTYISASPAHHIYLNIVT